jgi:hypothetical protein
VDRRALAQRQQDVEQGVAVFPYAHTDAATSSNFHR